MTKIKGSSIVTSSVTRWLDHIFNFGHLHNETLLNSMQYFAKVVSKFCPKLNKPSKIAKVAKFRQIRLRP